MAFTVWRWAFLIAGSATTLSAQTPAVPADVQFMRDMIMHHGQAIEMAHLVKEKSPSEAIRLMAERIDESQAAEIERMKRWLDARKAPAAQPHDHEHMHTTMPGMLSPEEMDQLREATGAAFDRFFLQFMIKHHNGALLMVRKLIDGGGVRDPELYMLATSIDADQRAEIARMQGMLTNLK